MSHVVHHVLLPARLPTLPEGTNQCDANDSENLAREPVIDDDVICLCKRGQRLGVVRHTSFFGGNVLRIRLPDTGSIGNCPKNTLNFVWKISKKKKSINQQEKGGESPPLHMF